MPEGGIFSKIPFGGSLLPKGAPHIPKNFLIQNTGAGQAAKGSGVF